MERVVEPFPITVEDVRAAILDTVAGLDLALDVGDWAEAADLTDWLRQLKIALELLEGF